ncbi:MAG: hypothetical protein ACRD3P_14900 [Terriglobales bacterium]
MFASADLFFRKRKTAETNSTANIANAITGISMEFEPLMASMGFSSRAEATIKRTVTNIPSTQFKTAARFARVLGASANKNAG